MEKHPVSPVAKAKRPQFLRSKVVSRPRDSKMDTVVRAVNRSPQFDVAAAAAAVGEALAASDEKAHA